MTGCMARSAIVFMSSCSAIPARTARRRPNARRSVAFVEMAYAMDLPLVATNDVYFPIPDVRGA